jgi:histidinol-phosphate aminotransferase
LIELPERIKNLSPYVAGKTIAEVKEAFGVERISKLASNENRLGCSPSVAPAVHDVLSEIQDYPDPVSRELRKELASRNNVDENEILVASGSESILSILCRMLLDTSTSVVTADATFVGIYVQAGVMGAEIKKVPVTPDYGFDTVKMLNAIGPETKMVYIANPNNPTGTHIGKEQYADFINRVPENVLIVADEAYFEYARTVPDYPHALDYRRENVVITRTFSKGYGLAGFRIGYAIAHPDLIAQMLKCKLTFEPTTPAQAAALAAVRDDSFLKKSVELVNEERTKLESFFDEHGINFVPSISNSTMMICDTEEEASELNEAMLQRGVILRQLTAFGLPHCIRITIGQEEEMTHFKDSLRAIKNLR